MSLGFRFINRHDLPQVVAIERNAFGDDWWTAPHFTAVLRERAMLGEVAVMNEALVGYIVHPLWRRKGIGKAMVHRLRAKLHPARNCLGVILPESHVEGQLFLKACGLRVKSIVKAHRCLKEDAYYFEYERGAESHRTAGP